MIDHVSTGVHENISMFKESQSNFKSIEGAKYHFSLPFFIFLMSSTPRPLCLYARATKKRKLTSHGESQVVAFTSKKRASKLQGLAGARETRYKDNHNNRKKNVL